MNAAEKQAVKELTREFRSVRISEYERREFDRTTALALAKVAVLVLREGLNWRLPPTDPQPSGDDSREGA